MGFELGGFALGEMEVDDTRPGSHNLALRNNKNRKHEKTYPLTS